jgi:hypothetical protein
MRENPGMPTFNDGSKGITMAREVQRLAPVFPEGIKNYTDYKRWAVGCTYPLIVSATYQDSVSFLAFGKRRIMTRERFIIDEVVQAPDGFEPGKVVELGVFGGDVVDEGVHLRLFNSNAGAPPVPDQRYLLLGRRGSNPDALLSGPRFVGSTAARRLDDWLYVEHPIDNDSPLYQFEEFSQFRAAVRDFVSRIPCPVLRKSASSG